MIDGVDSSKNQVGDVFHASLETDLYIRDALVARKGADVYGRLSEAKEAGHLSGSAELQLELIRIVIDGHDYPLVSSDYSLKGPGRTRQRRWEAGRSSEPSSAPSPVAEKAQPLAQEQGRRRVRAYKCSRGASR
jgi:hypothetical protein